MTNTEQEIKEFREKFLAKGSECTWNFYPEPEEIEQFLLSSIREAEQRGREEERRRIIEEIKQWTGGGRQSDGYEQAIDDVIFSLFSTDDVSSKEENHIDDANKMVVNKDESKPIQKEEDLVDGHKKTCRWIMSDCIYKLTHNYCPHEEHLCDCQ